MLRRRLSADFFQFFFIPFFHFFPFAFNLLYARLLFVNLQLFFSPFFLYLRLVSNILVGRFRFSFLYPLCVQLFVSSFPHALENSFLSILGPFLADFCCPLLFLLFHPSSPSPCLPILQLPTHSFHLFSKKNFCLSTALETDIKFFLVFIILAFFHLVLSQMKLLLSMAVVYDTLVDYRFVLRYFFFFYFWISWTFLLDIFQEA